MAEGIGSINFWGFSPAVDLQTVAEEELSERGALNILLIGTGDGRHLLKTISRIKRYHPARPRLCGNSSFLVRHQPRELHFYVVESSLELIARQLVFINLALSTQEVHCDVETIMSFTDAEWQDLGLQDKAEIFLELFGNSAIRSVGSGCILYLRLILMFL